MLGRIFVRPFLGLCSKIYGVAVTAAYRRYRDDANRRRRVGARVISIGNITWGGTGKTPLVIMLARAIGAKGKRVAVLTRGYGGDETHELQNALAGIPVLPGRDRVKTAETAVSEHRAEIIILDDGFQHWRLHRSCDVVAVNCTNPFGNEALLPLGILREPLRSLDRADIFVLTKASLGRHNVNLVRQRLREINPRAAVFEADHDPVRFLEPPQNRPVELGAVQRKKAAILTGIEDPASFERILCHLGADIVYAARFNDHHPFSVSEINEVFNAYRELDAEVLVTTQKDFYRLGRILDRVDARGVRILVLQIEMRLDDEEDFVRRCANL